MRTRRVLTTLAALAGIAVSLVAAGTALADGPAGEPAPTVLQALPQADQAPGQQSVTLSARLYSGEGQAVSGEALGFYVLATVFGERLMKVGDILTDATGTASLLYEPTWAGDHTVVVRYGGSDDYAPAQTSFHVSAAGPVPVHKDALFGLEPVRRWLPSTIGVVVLAVWGVLVLVVVRTVLGIPAAAPAAEPVPMPVAEPLRPASLGRPLLLVAALVLIALPLAWLRPWERGEEASLQTESARFGETYGQEVVEPAEEPLPAVEKALPATLIRSVQTMTTDARGQLTPDSADLPADVALIDGRLFILDTNKGRILAVTGDGKLAPIFESEREGDTSLLGAVAMTVHDGRLYVASSRAGNVVVLSPSGRVERVIKPQVPEGQRPLRPAGIAITDQGQIWLSDSDNHRVLLLNEQGGFLGAIGQGTQSSGEYGFDTPGGLALDHLGNLRVVDTMNHRVKRYSPMGVFLSAIGEGQLAEPKAVAVDEAGNIFVTDDELLAVLVFGMDGAFLGSIGKEDPAAEGSRSWLQAPHGLQVEGNLVYVMDRLAGLLVFQLEGDDES